MREKNDQHQGLPRQRTPAADIIEELGQVEQPQAGLPSPDETTAIRLPHKRRASRRLHPRAALADEPAPAGSRRQSYWTAAGAAALAACLGLAMGFALASTRPPGRSHAPRRAMNAKPSTPPGARIERPARRRPTPPASRHTPAYPAGDSNQPALPQAPPTSPGVSTTPPAHTPPPPTPAQETGTEAQTHGGPFSP
jgi:hypothetical protein